jgi:hypothetical protein
MIRAHSIVVRGRGRSPRTWNPDTGSELVSGFRVWRYAPAGDDIGNTAEGV